MIYAPVLITTLFRYDKLKTCLYSLAKNGYAKETDVFVYVDYPCKEEHKDGYRQICEYLSKFDVRSFKSFSVVKRKENLGFLKNQRMAIDDIFEKYDTFIRTNDDAEFSPNFLEWIDKCLDTYKDDEDVLAISGYSYPVKWKVSEGATAIRGNFVAAEWGVGYWKDKYLKVEKIFRYGYFKNNFKDNLTKAKEKQLIDARYINLIDLSIYDSIFDDPYKVTNFVTDVTLGTYIGLEDKFVIMPVISKVRDTGFDGTGIYCQNIMANDNKTVNAHNFDYTKQIIDANYHICINDETGDNLSFNRDLLDNFDRRKLKQLAICKLKLAAYKVLRAHTYGRILNKFKRV